MPQAVDTENNRCRRWRNRIREVLDRIEDVCSVLMSAKPGALFAFLMLTMGIMFTASFLALALIEEGYRTHPEVRKVTVLRESGDIDTCLIDIWATFTEIGAAVGQVYMRYEPRAIWWGDSQCHAGEAVGVDQASLEQARQALRERQSLVEREKVRP